ncbi:MAG: LacI family DNA-binding transcriptional regulator [Erysipelothrix sp.]
MKNPTIKDIAQKLGISVATVSRVLNNSGYASNEVREQVLECAKELNYTPNIAAKSLKVNKTNTIGVIIPDISNSYFMSAAKGIEDALESDDLTLIIASTDENESKEQRVLKTLMQHRVDCLVLATSGLDKIRLEKLLPKSVPVVLFDRLIENDNSYNYVVEDNYQGAYELMKDVLHRGHTDIGFVVGSLRVSTGKERLRGVNECLQEHNIEIPEFNYFYGNYTLEDGRRAADYFLHMETIPTAIVSFNNTMTQGMINRFAEKNSHKENKILIASYGSLDFENLLDDQYFFSHKQYPYYMGKEVGKIINDILKDNKIEKQVTYKHGDGVE